MASRYNSEFQQHCTTFLPEVVQSRRGRQQQRRRHLNRVLDVEQILELLQELKQEQEQEKCEQSQRIRREQQILEEKQVIKDHISESNTEHEVCVSQANSPIPSSEEQRKQRYAQQKRRQKLQQRILDIELLQQFLRELKQQDTSDTETTEKTSHGNSVFMVAFFCIFIYFTFLDVYKYMVT